MRPGSLISTFVINFSKSSISKLATGEISISYLVSVTKGPLSNYLKKLYSLPTKAEMRKKRSTVKPVLRGHLKIDKTKVLMENGSLTKAKSIAECSPWRVLQYF